MDITLKHPNCYLVPSFTFFSPQASSDTSKNQKQKKRKHINQSPKTKFSFPRSYPTPLLINHKPHPKTKLEALDGIVNDLESSVEKGIRLDPQTFASLLETCFQLQAIDYGFRIHRLIPEKLLRKNVGLSSKLLRLYASGGHIENAHQVFDQMSAWA